MQAIRLLQKEGYDISLDGENIRCLKIPGKNPNPNRVNRLLNEIKKKKNEAVSFLKICEPVITDFNKRIINMMDIPEITRKRALNLQQKMTFSVNNGQKDEFLICLEK